MSLQRTRLDGSPGGVRHVLAVDSEEHLLLMLHAISAGFRELIATLEGERPSLRWMRGPEVLKASSRGLSAAALQCPVSPRVRVELTVLSEEGGWAEVEGSEVREG